MTIAILKGIRIVLLIDHIIIMVMGMMATDTLAPSVKVQDA